MRAGRASMVVAAALLLLLALGAASASARTRPRNDAILSSPPLLNWRSVPGAVRYNVQLYRQTKRGPRKILSRFPARSRYQLHHRWHYHNRLKRFTVARYYWYVWPWFGSAYGRLQVNRGFVRGAAPVNTSPPTLTGGAREGAMLAANAGTWTGLPLPTFSYRWQQCGADGSACADIPGGTLATYRVATADIDRVVRVLIVATNIARTVTAQSAPSAVVRAAPPNNYSRPRVGGHPHVGALLQASPGGWISSRPLTYSYQWLRCDRAGGSCAQISGATGRSYRVHAADAAGRVGAVVRAANSGGAHVARSRPSAVVGLEIEGSSSPELLRGTLGSDVIRAHGGADTVYGGGGRDRIHAGGGSDHLFGGARADLIVTRDRFRDWIDCGRGIDRVRADRHDRVSSNCEHVVRR